MQGRDDGGGVAGGRSANAQAHHHRSLSRRATSTISIATMLSSSSSPAVVPLTIASMVLEVCISGSSNDPPVRLSEVSGTMIRLIRIAAGAKPAEEQRIPFGTYLCLSTWLVWLYGPLIVR